MYQNLIIPIDHGNRNMKTEQFTYTSGLVESECKPALGEYLFYRDKFYTLTDQRIPYMRDKTMDERFFILTLFGIALEAEKKIIKPEDMVLQVDLPIGLPPKHYGSLYKRFENYFKGRGIQQFTYKDSAYNVQIGNVVAYPQDYSAAMTVFKSIAEYSKVITVDIGGFTLDYLLLRNGKPDLSTCDSLEKGVITLYNKIISRINSEYDMLLEDADIDSIIMKKKTDFGESIIRTIQEMTKTYVDDLLGTLRERGLDLKTGCVVFIGGGALLLREYLKSSEKVGTSIFIEDINANAKGYGLLYNIQKRGR